MSKNIFKNILISFFLVSMYSFSFGQGFNIDLVGTLPYTESLSDIWSWDQGDQEYALVGVFDGLSIVDVSTPSNPTEVQFIGGASSIWRDIKTYNGYVYVTNESDDGILIANLNELPNASFVNYTANNYFTTAHNIYIDEFGYAYITGPNAANGGVLIMDLNADPLAPPIVGEYTDFYVHDCYARNNILYTAEVYEGQFRVIDVSDKSNLVVLGEQLTSSEFTHNIWPNDAGTIVFTTDEVSGAFVDAYDISDVNNIEQLDLFQSNPNSGVIPHNAHVLDDYVVISYYRDGIVVLDGSQPDVLVEVGNYDTSPLQGNGFDGSWGATPFLPSGHILASDIEEGLFVLEPNYVRAAIVKGNVTDSNYGNPIQNVTIEVISESINTLTSLSGDYATGTANAGTYDVKFSRLGFNDYIATGVNLIAGQVTVVDAVLIPTAAFALASNVTDINTGIGIENATIQISDGLNETIVSTDADGNITVPNFFGGNYDIGINIWGYETVYLENEPIDSNYQLMVELTPGYCDDFNFDNGWIAYDEASSGNWELGVPNGTSTNDGSQANPGEDVTIDFGDNCFVTGNGGGGAGQDDIDDGFVRLTSPIFDPTNFYVPALSYSRWFFNDGGQGTIPDDHFRITLFNGTDSLLLEDITSTANFWQEKMFNIDTLGLLKTNTMQLILEAADVNEGHLVEAAFDNFKVFEGQDLQVSTEDIKEELQINILSNPFATNTTVQLPMLTNSEVFDIKIYDATAQLVATPSLEGNSFQWGANVNTGMYLMVVLENNKIVAKRKLIKQ